MKYSERLDKSEFSYLESLSILDEIQSRLNILETPIPLHRFNDETYTYCTLLERQFLDELKENGQLDHCSDYVISKNGKLSSVIFQKDLQIKLKDIFK